MVGKPEEHSNKERLATEWANLPYLNSVRTTAILKNSDGAMKALMANDLTETSKRVAEEQTATTDEISNNIRSINDTVQGTARSAQESAASAQQLSVLEEQQRLVGQFKLV